MALTDTQLREVRAEVGAAPDDTTLNSLFDDLQNLTAVSLAVLRPRLADARTAAAQGGFTLSGVLGTTAPTADVLRQMDAQISRLESQLAAETGETDTSGLSASSVLVGRTDRPR